MAEKRACALTPVMPKELHPAIERVAACQDAGVLATNGTVL